MAKTFRTYLPEQNLLLPASLREWLPDDHLSYFVSDVVDQLDLSAIESVYEDEDRGQPPYHPRMMTKILLYGYCVGVFSSRRIQKRLREEVGKLLNQAEAADQEEDSRYGRDRRGDELPEELQRRETRMARIREAKHALEERAQEQAKSKGKDPEEAQPTKKAQYNFTDPESRMLKGSDGFLQGYNTQIAVEPVFQLILGQRVTQAANDKQQMAPLIEAIEEQSGQKPEGVLADNGYCSDENLKYLVRKRMEGFVATGKQKHSERREPCQRGPLPREASRVEHRERKLETKVGAAIYATRKFIVEPVFGQIKQARGFRQFLLRGIEKVRGEWALICMTHNLLKFHKICSG